MMGASANNKFATMLHRNTNKITLVLTYALLEWILILLLLFNSLLSYLIIKFADFFGLKPPSPCRCTRLYYDHDIFDHPCSKGANRKKSYHLLCEVHDAKEISNLMSYCSNHCNLAQSRDMCNGCLSGSISSNFPLFPFANFCTSCCGVSSSFKYSPTTTTIIYSSNYHVNNLKTPPSNWDDVIECPQKEENLITDHTCLQQQGRCDSHKTKRISDDLYDDEKVLAGDNTENDNIVLSQVDDEIMDIEVNGSTTFDHNELMKGEEYHHEIASSEMGKKKETFKESPPCLVMKQDKSFEEDGCLEISPQHLEFFLDYSGHKLVPVELYDTITEDDQSKDNVKRTTKVHEEECSTDYGIEADQVKEENMVIIMDNNNNRCRLVEEVDDDGVFDLDINEEPKSSVLIDTMEMEEGDENSLVFHANEYHSMMMMMQELNSFPKFPAIQFHSEDAKNVQEFMAAESLAEHSDVVHTECEEEIAQMEINETEADVSIGTDIPDLDITDDQLQNQESFGKSYEYTHEDPSTSCAKLNEADDNNGPIKVKERMVELHWFEIQDRVHMMNDMNQPPLFNEIQEDTKFPDTPTSMDSLTDQLHKKRFHFLEKRDSGTEESVDGSVTSELECGDEVVTVERLKSALRAERKSLQALYAELEKERSASAVAANQTMAMINRLQEEKAATQMEALQYQRMMDEQSEYDQEALQLLNELMVKREKEKQELEKELEAYRKNIFDYETKDQKIRVMLKRSNNRTSSSRSGFSSAYSSSNNAAEDSDGLSIDLNQDAKEEEGSCGHDDEYGEQSTPVVDAVVNLEESLADFEDERLSILAQLKVLEEKLLTLDDDENEQHFENVKEMEDENGHSNGEVNGPANGFLNGRCNQQSSRIAGQKGKSLLPLFDAINDENGDLMPNGNGNEFHSYSNDTGHNNSYISMKFENKKVIVDIEEEVDHLYERLQALEADREFLKHCVSSIKKGDSKGMDLLREILQHLRDLRNVEQHQ